MDHQFWNGKRVFVTGHTGFKGSWLSLLLHSLGAKVTGYALPPPTDPSLFQAVKIESDINSVIGDVRDLESLIKIMEKEKPDIVFHLAAQSLVRYSYENPVETYSTNVMGTVNLLEAVRKTPSVRTVVVITSDKCYENKEWVWGYRENDAMGGNDPYSNSKGCVELLTAAYRNSFFKNNVQVATARAGNVIGGGDWAIDRLIPDAIRAFTRKETVMIRNPESIRPWQQVLEPLCGYMTLAEHMCLGENQYSSGWNFGPDYKDMKKVEWIIEVMAKKWKEEANWNVDNNINPHEANTLKLDCSKAMALLNWKPTLTINESLTWTVDWYKNYYENNNVKQISLKQINDYLEKIS